jgi:hypothetical protein
VERAVCIVVSADDRGNRAGRGGICCFASILHLGTLVPVELLLLLSSSLLVLVLLLPLAANVGPLCLVDLPTDFLRLPGHFVEGITAKRVKKLLVEQPELACEVLVPLLFIGPLLLGVDRAQVVVGSALLFGRILGKGLGSQVLLREIQRLSLVHAVECLLQLLSVNVVLKSQLLQVLLADKRGLGHLVLLYAVKWLLSSIPVRICLQQVLGNGLVELLLSDLRIALQQPHREFVHPLLLVVPHLLLLLLLSQIHRSSDLNSGSKLLADSVNFADHVAVLFDLKAQFLDQGKRPFLILLLAQCSSLLLLPECLESGR